MVRYFYSVDDRTRIGPVTLETLRAKAVSGELQPDHFVFVEGSGAWVEARTLPGVYPSTPSTSPTETAAPAAPRRSTLRPIRTSEYASLPRVREMPMARGLYGPPEPCPIRYRAAAAVADAAIAALLIAVLVPVARALARAFVSHPEAAGRAGWFILILAATIIPWLYHAGMESSPFGATLGKMALTIRVVDSKGHRPTFRRATCRHFAKILSVLPLGVGIVSAWLDPKLRTWHDRLTRTAVERTPPV